MRRVNISISLTIEIDIICVLLELLHKQYLFIASENMHSHNFLHKVTLAFTKYFVFTIIVSLVIQVVYMLFTIYFFCLQPPYDGFIFPTIFPHYLSKYFSCLYLTFDSNNVEVSWFRTSSVYCNCILRYYNHIYVALHLFIHVWENCTYSYP